MSDWKNCSELSENIKQTERQKKLDYLDICFDEIKRLMGVRDSTVGEIRNYIALAERLTKEMRQVK